MVIRARGTVFPKINMELELELELGLEYWLTAKVNILRFEISL